MTNPKDFYLNSDYTTLKNDAKGSTSVTIISGTSAANGTWFRFVSTIDIGSVGADMRYQMRVGSGDWLPTPYMQVGVTIGAATEYFNAYVKKESAGGVSLVCDLFNNSGSTMTISGSTTVFLDVATYLSPFV